MTVTLNEFNNYDTLMVSSQIDGTYLFWYNIYFMCNLFEYY